MRSALRDLPSDQKRLPTGHLFLSRAGMIGRLTPHPGRREALVERLLLLADHAQQAPGCYLYLIHEAAENPDDLWVVEAWRSRAQHDAWLGLPQIRELMHGAEELIADAQSPVLTIPVGGKGLAVRHRNRG